ncbi:hypothetical protein HMPREF0083_05388 [Aneurinibacillus aneurinilyticus ATCC 12856]|uniref:Uncharacterized protein n=1 Tax=Aneurinibacillus aneurinilyticus ATCC 12856 TaxID=649747 RepID=U1Y1V6_ANEAE|nr:hypothetical protein HMPREF0083_05388 [Aneurinibacillus aneurinilyticus ATCC 12856]
MPAYFLSLLFNQYPCYLTAFRKKSPSSRNEVSREGISFG